MRSEVKENQSGRRRFLLMFPLAVFSSILVTVLANAFRFLRPRTFSAAEKPLAGGDWNIVGQVSEFSGDQPMMRPVVSEVTAGWTTAVAEHSIYILPGPRNRVLSAVCPHEGCTVQWQQSAGLFVCPCHNSRFLPDGSLKSGPARSGLAEIPSRVEDGVLQVQPLDQTSANHASA